MWEAGADGIDFDTAGAAGDGDFLATLRGRRDIRAAHPDMGIEVGMAGEFVLGMHGGSSTTACVSPACGRGNRWSWRPGRGDDLRAGGEREHAAGSCAWNIARALTLVKPCCDDGRDPHPHERGHGRGRRADEQLRRRVDAVSRASRACVDILHLDGL